MATIKAALSFMLLKITIPVCFFISHLKVRPVYLVMCFGRDWNSTWTPAAAADLDWVCIRKHRHMNSSMKADLQNI